MKRLFPLAALLVLGLTACGEEGQEGDACEVDADCAEGLECHEHDGEMECEAHDDEEEDDMADEM